MKRSPLGTAGLALLASSLLLFSSNLRGQIPTPADPAPDTEAAPEATPTPPPGFAPGDVTPTENTDVSTLITSGCGYDAWSGAVRRTVTDMVVPGAVSSHGLSVVRTYSSSNGTGWSMSWHWRMYFRGYGSFDYMVHMPHGRTMRFDGSQANPKRSSVGTRERLYSYGLNQTTGTADLFLEDGSVVHFTRITDDTVDNRQVDYFTAETFTDPYGLVTVLTNTAYIPEKPYVNHLTKVTDPSQRSLTFKYEDPQSASILTSIVASTGETVAYGGVLDGLTSVNYNDGTSAQYTFDTTTYKDPKVPGQINEASSLSTAVDVRAEGPMRSIMYTYVDEAKFQGQIKQEQHPSGLLVSKLAADNGPESDQTTNYETRGDGPIRSFFITKPLGKNVPLLREKSDFKGPLEKYEYDGGNYLKKITDRNGNETTFTNEQVLGRPLIVTHDDGAFATGTPYPLTTREYTYTDPANPYYVASVKDDRNNYTTYQRYPATHRIMQIDHPDGGTETFDYNDFGQVIRHKRQNGFYEFFDYDTTGLLKTRWNPIASPNHPSSGAKTTYSYYTGISPWRSRVKTVTDARVFRTTYEYDKVFDAAGVQTSVPCSGRGLITKVSFPDDTHGGVYLTGTSMSYVYDIYGNMLTETQNQLGEITTYTYDEHNRLNTMKLPNTDAIPNQRATVYDYTPDRSAPPNDVNPLSHTTNSVWRETSPSLVETARTFDENFRLSSETIGDQDPIHRATTSFGYDSYGNQTVISDPREIGDGKYTTYTDYDARNRKMQVRPPAVPDFGVEKTQWEYDGNNNVTKIVRADNTEVKKEYDTMNRLTKDTQPKEPNVTAITLMDYNPAGTLKTLTDAKNRVTTFYYNENDLKSSVSYPPNGQGVADYEAYEYDQNYNLLNRRATSGIYQVFEYDERNRQKRMGWFDGKTVMTTQHAWANGVYDNAYAYDASGRMTSAANINSTVLRTWDKAGRMLSDQELFANVSFTVPPHSYAYRDDGAVTRVYVGDDQSYDFAFGYDGLGRFITSQYVLDVTTDVDYSYDQASNVVSRTTNNNGTNIIYQVDNLNRITQRDINIPGANWSREHYSFDARDRVTDTLRDEDGKRDHFEYNQMGEMKKAQYGIITGPPAREVSYAWDKSGNRTSVINAGVTQNYVPNYLNQYNQVAGQTVSNGPAHEIASYDGVSYAYVGDTYPARATASGTGNTYTLYYDALGRTVRRQSIISGTTSGRYYLFNGERWILEYNESGVSTFNQLYGVGFDEIIGQCRKVNGVWDPRWPYPDRNTNTSVVTGPNGVILESYRYDAFGQPSVFAPDGTLLAGTAIEYRFLFTGREWNPEFKFYEYRNRAYSPSLGRFMSEDPKGFDAGDYNLYRYVSNDPLDRVDPMGLETFYPDARVTAYSYGRDNAYAGHPNGYDSVARATDPARRETVRDSSGKIDVIQHAAIGDNSFAHPSSMAVHPDSNIPFGSRAYVGPGADGKPARGWFVVEDTHARESGGKKLDQRFDMYSGKSDEKTMRALDGRAGVTVYGPKEKVPEKMQQMGPGAGGWPLSETQDRVIFTTGSLIPVRQKTGN